MSDPFSTPATRGKSQNYIDENGIERDGRWDRPIIEGSSYTRATTMARVLADEYNIHAWKMRMLAHGLTVGSDDLLKLASTMDPTDKANNAAYVSEVIEPALDRAGANAGRKKGTALHSLTHKLDAGTPIASLPGWARGYLTKYEAALTSRYITIDPGHIEVFTVASELKSAGTADRLMTVPGLDGLIVGDLKTQKDHPETYNALEISIQLALYARGLNTRGIWRPSAARDGSGTWDTSCVGRVNQETAVVMWLPVDGEHAGECHLVEIDIKRGWTLAQMADRIRAERSAAKTLVRPLRPMPDAASVTIYQNSGATVMTGGETLPRELTRPHAQPIADRIDAAFPLDAVTDYAGRQCPDGRVHGAHDGCPGRKRRSPAQIAADAEQEAQQIAPGVTVEAADAALSDVTEYGLTQGGVKFRISVSAAGYSSTCVEHEDGMTFANEVTAQHWRKLHVEREHPHVLLEAAQQPVSGPGIDAAVAAAAGLGRLPDDEMLDALENEAPPVESFDRAAAADAVFDRLAQEPAPTMDPVIVLRAKIRKCATPEELSALWKEHSTIWSEELTALGKQVLASAGRG